MKASGLCHILVGNMPVCACVHVPVSLSLSQYLSVFMSACLSVVSQCVVPQLAFAADCLVRAQ